MKQLEQKLKSALEHLKELDTKTLYYILAGVLAAFLIVDFFVLMKPQISALNNIAAESAKITKNLEEAASNIEKQPQNENKITRLKKKVAFYESKIKHQQETPLILEKVSLMAEKNGLEVDQITPDAKNQTMILETENRRYYFLPINMKVRSSYHDLGRFINDVENDDLFLNVYLMTVQPVQGSKMHSVEITLRTIVYEKYEKSKEEKKDEKKKKRKRKKGKRVKRR